MGKFLKVVVIFVFLASIGAAVLAYMNFDKRKMLTGRAEVLEKAIGRLAATFDAADPVQPDMAPDFVERDVEDVRAREITTPDTAHFWDNYRVELESTDGAKLDMRKLNKDVMIGDVAVPQIRNFYFVDSDGKRVKTLDSYGFQTTGKGTMSELLDQVQERASAQSSTLNATRNELRKVREELLDTIREVNGEKKARRKNLVEIDELKSNISALNSEKVDLQAKANRLENANAQLSDEKKNADAALAEKSEEYDNLVKQFNDLKRKYEDILIGKDTATPGSGDTVAKEAGSGRSTPGVKGSVVFASPDASFLIIKLTPEAVEELTVTSDDGSKATRSEEYMVRRKGFSSASGDLVSRVKIESVRRDGSNLAVAGNLPNWQQAPVAPGDEVFF